MIMDSWACRLPLFRVVAVMWTAEPARPYPSDFSLASGAFSKPAFPDAWLCKTPEGSWHELDLCLGSLLLCCCVQWMSPLVSSPQASCVPGLTLLLIIGVVWHTGTHGDLAFTCM